MVPKNEVWLTQALAAARELGRYFTGRVRGRREQLHKPVRAAIDAAATMKTCAPVGYRRKPGACQRIPRVAGSPSLVQPL